MARAASRPPGGSFAPSLKDCFQVVAVLPPPDQVQLEIDRTTLVIVRPGGQSNNLPISADWQNWWEQQQFKNRVLFLTGSRDTFQKVLDAARQTRALDSIATDLRSENMPPDDPQWRALDMLRDRIALQFSASLKEAFDQLVYPSINGALRASGIDLAFAGNQSGEATVRKTLETAHKFTTNIGEEAFRTKAEARLFGGADTKVVLWSDFKRNAAVLTTWQLHKPSALDDLKADCVRRDVWREEGIARRTGRTEGAANSSFAPDAGLSEEQRRAVEKILGSYAFITLFRGPAGSGKSRTLLEVKRGLEAARRPVVVLAPQRQQVLDLEGNGLPAQTLARFLATGEVPNRAAILLDEASQVGIRDLHNLVNLARNAGARLFLSGDTRQHGAVAASDALVLLERHAGLPVARLKTIRRQDPQLAATAAEKRAIAEYRSAVRLASRGRAVQAFDRLDKLGWVHQQRPEEGRERVAEHYCSTVQRKERALVVAQTWVEVDAVNLAIRANLRENGFLGEGVALIGYRAFDHTVAEKQDAGTFPVGTKVFFLKRYSRYLRGDICTVVEASPRGLTLLRGGRKGRLAYRYADSVAVLRERPIELAPGDRIQIKWNGRSLDDKPLVNGELATIRRIHADGRIEIESDRGQEKILGPHQRLFNYGYACTSYASQGKTVDTVLFSDAGSRPATNQKQWFVTISRARRRVLVFTPDKPALRFAIAAEGHRPLASEAKRGGRPVSGYRKAVIRATMPTPSGPNQGVGIRR